MWHRKSPAGMLYFCPKVRNESTMANDVFSDNKVSRAYFKLAIPLVCSMVVTLIYNLADTYFVAQTGDTNIVAGVSLGMPVFTLLMALGNIFGQGGSSLISRLLGQQDTAGARRVSSFCFYGTLIVGVVMAAVMLLARVPLVWLLGASDETFVHASDYYFWLSAGAPIIMLSFIHSNLLRAEGMSRESMTGTILGALVNIVLDPIFISGLGMGAAGAAIATVIGYLCADVCYAVFVVRKSQVLSLDPRRMAISFGHFGQIMGIGIPAAVVNIMQSAAAVLMNQFLLPYGNDKIAAMGIVLKVSMIALLLLTGFAFGGQPLFGFYYGAGDTRRFSALLRFCLGFISGSALVLTAGICLTAPALMRVFMDNEGIIRDGTLMLRWQVITMVFVGFVLLLSILFQSTGKAAPAFILSISRQGVIFAAALIAARQLGGYTGILAAQAIADTITAVVAAGLFYTQLYRELR